MTISPSDLRSLDTAALTQVRDNLQSAYDELCARDLHLDLTRGKPSAAQLDLSNDLLTLPGTVFRDEAGTDLRNYGGANGLPELREIFAAALRVPVRQLLAGGNSSLNIMHDTLVQALLYGVPDGDAPWSREPISFLTPVPGYDRHFTITERLGIRMIPVPMNDDGPDVDAVSEALQRDDSIRGMWCVPVYSNPTGAVYSEDVVRALVSLPAAPDFRLFWDNAYAVHHLSDEVPAPIDVLGLAAEAGHPNRPVIFASTSKITFPGAGVAFFGSSATNVAWYLHNTAAASIGPDKLNHLRHAQFLRDPENLAAHMAKHRAILEPKFAAVQEIFAENLGPWHAGEWTHPRGGYFVSLDVLPGCAARSVALAKAAGIAVTPAGATFPCGDDPRDANIRIAPTMPPLEELQTALTGLCTCIVLAEANHLLGE